MASPSKKVIEPQTLPLSPAESRMWFMSRLEPASSAYNLTSAHRCRGLLDVEALEWALNEVVRRHVILRTFFAENNGIPFPIVRDGFELALPVTRYPSSEDWMDRCRA